MNSIMEQPSCCQCYAVFSAGRDFFVPKKPHGSCLLGFLLPNRKSRRRHERDTTSTPHFCQCFGHYICIIHGTTPISVDFRLLYDGRAKSRWFRCYHRPAQGHHFQVRCPFDRDTDGQQLRQCWSVCTSPNFPFRRSFKTSRSLSLPLPHCYK
jgi:hypothetical protein